MYDPTTKHPYFKGATYKDAYIAGWEDSAAQVGSGDNCTRGAIWNAGAWPESLEDEYVRGHYMSARSRNEAKEEK